MNASWPIADNIDDVLIKEEEYIDEVSHDFRVRVMKMLELREKVINN